MVRNTNQIQPRKYGAVKKAGKLSPQQRMFVEEMVADPLMSPSQAALKAGYSPKTAAVKASNMLKNPVIMQMIGKALSERIERVQVTQDDILKFLYQGLMLDPLDLFHQTDESLTMKQLQEIPKDIRRLITKLDVKTRPVGDDGQVETRVKLEWVSKELVLQLCMKHLGMGIKDDKGDVNVNVQVVTNNNLIQQLREAVASKGKVIDGKVISKLATSE
jgi:phage terminase small subunit